MSLVGVYGGYGI